MQDSSGLTPGSLLLPDSLISMSLWTLHILNSAQVGSQGDANILPGSAACGYLDAADWKEPQRFFIFSGSVFLCALRSPWHRKR